MSASLAPTTPQFQAADRQIYWRAAVFPCRILTPVAATAGPPLLVLGGGLQTRHSWTRLEQRLAPHHPMLIPDLPPAQAPGGPDLNWDDLTDAAISTLDQAGVRQTAVLAVSSGYPVGYRLAQQHPRRITHLMLFGASPKPAPRLTALIQQGLHRIDQMPCAPHARAEQAGHLVALLTNPQAAADNLLMRAAAKVLLQHLLSAPHDPLTAYVRDRGALLLDQPLPPGGISGVPTLVGVGEHDTTTTVADNRAVAATIHGAELTVLDNCDHLLHMERDADFASLVADFLRRGTPAEIPGCTTETLP
ncbi:alpha/beta hydrolase [Streptomyces sp. SUK 48]|uniref:alpha/beta fold hydrolase n=1 Tax=Streptomyces sp. SUK 48 TaxID=2582831 RepID=UPI00129AE281|nr:alpha/beta hydrolase [Streptomyces sp. SUK 48]